MTNELTKQNNPYFESSDLSLCSALCCHGYEIEKIIKNNSQKAIFLIRKDGKLEGLIKKFWAHQLKVDSLSYFNFLKEIKSRIYNLH